MPNLLILVLLALGLGAGASAFGQAGAQASGTNATAAVSFAQSQGEMGDWLSVTVEDPPPELTGAISGRKKAVLVLGDFPLKGLQSSATMVSNNLLKFSFHLEWVESASTNWTALLRKPHLGALPLSVGIGLEDGSIPVLSADPNRRLEFTTLPTWQVGLWGVLLVVFLMGFVWLCGWTELLRDSGPDPGAGQHRPFSLGRTQMAIWFFLAVVGFVFLRVITGGAQVAITNTVLALMGIAAGTGLGAAAQDSNKAAKLRQEFATLQALAARTADQDRRLNNLKILLADRGSLETERAALAAVAAPTAAQTARLAEVTDLLAQSLPIRISHGFFEDVLTDDVGISFHRFQMFVWTIVLAVFFIEDVLNNLAMPEFGSTLLALMGISSGTYLGFMINEPHSSEMTKT